MQDNAANRINKQANDEKNETPKMTKPVTGQFKKHRKQLGTMLKNSRTTKKGDK